MRPSRPAGPPHRRLPLAALLLLLAAGQAAAQARLYRSNSLGLPLEELAGRQREEPEWLLEVSAAAGPRAGDGGEVRRLLQRGQEVRRWEERRGSEGREVRLFEKGALSEVQRWDREGRLVEEERHEEGALQTRTVYRWSGRALREAEVSDASGALLWRERYRLTGDGELRSVRREGPDGEGQGFSLLRSRGRLREERQQKADELILTRYDPRGRLRQREVWQKGVQVSVLEYRYDGGRLEAVTESDPRSGAQTARRFDGEGRLLQEEEQQQGRTASDTRSEYDAEGRKSRTVRRGEQGLEEWLYEYAADGALQREEYRVKGALVKVTRQGPNGTRTEELYREGKPFLRISYEGEEKIREEVLAGGEVVRVREYRGRQGAP